MSRLPSTLNVLRTAALALVLGGAVAPAAAQTEIRVATLAPEGSKWMQVLDKTAIEVKAATTERVSVKFFAGGSQGDEKDFIRKIKLGQLDGAAVTAVGLSMIEESIRVLELPMMFDNQAEFDYVADKMWGYFVKKFEAKGFKLNDRGEVGWIYFLSKEKVETVAHLRAQKIWAWGDDALVQAMFKALGLSSISLAVPEVDSALGAGRINAAYGSPLAAVALQWYTKVKYMTSMPMLYSIGATVISLDAVKKMSAEDQKTVLGIVKKNGKALRKAIRKENIAAQKTMTRKGVTVVTTPQATIDEFRAAGEKTWTTLVGKLYSQKELDMVLKHRADYRAKNPK